MWGSGCECGRDVRVEWRGGECGEYEGVGEREM